MTFTTADGRVIGKPKGSKTMVTPTKQARSYRKLLSVLCGVSEKTIQIYFSNLGYPLHNPYSVKKFLEDRIRKLGGFDDVNHLF